MPRKPKAPDTDKNPVGRPHTPIDWEEFDKLCQLQCTLEEISGWFNCSEDTIERAVLRERDSKFADYHASKAASGRIALRRKQHQVAMEGNVTMLIWLGKQRLGQMDRFEKRVIEDPKKAVATEDQVQVLTKQLEALIEAREQALLAPPTIVPLGLLDTRN